MIVTLQKPSTKIAVSQNDNPKVEITRPSTTVKVFPNGTPPRNNGSLFNRYVAGETIGGQRIVVTNASGEVVIGDQTNLAHIGLFTGITRTAVTVGASVDVLSFGQMTDVAFNFTPEQKIYFGTNGLITQTPPTTGFTQSIGHAISATTIFINAQVPSELN